MNREGARPSHSYRLVGNVWAMSTLPARAGRRCHHAVNPFHSAVYFSRELREEMAALGVTDPNAAYFASRAAAFGAVGPGTVTATFFNFRHDLVARHLPAVWEVATPAQVLDARLRAADRTLRRLLGEEAVAAPDVAEAAELALRAAEDAPAPAARSTPPTPTCRSRPSRTSPTGTPRPCCASTGATPTSPRSSTRSSTRSRR